MIGLPTRELLLGGGDIHRATQRIPARTPRPAVRPPPDSRAAHRRESRRWAARSGAVGV
ncbi:hypothetical protein ACIODX_25870 [Streptomyces sp. NPDC088190]|uniref:hypothetical protein n=1 Tax=unclassified Streptomyces TaxID=2593676 RepID=UPI003812D67D